MTAHKHKGHGIVKNGFTMRTLSGFAWLWAAYGVVQVVLQNSRCSKENIRPTSPSNGRGYKGDSTVCINHVLLLLYGPSPGPRITHV